MFQVDTLPRVFHSFPQHTVCLVREMKKMWTFNSILWVITCDVYSYISVNLAIFFPSHASARWGEVLCVLLLSLHLFQGRVIHLPPPLRSLALPFLSAKGITTNKHCQYINIQSHLVPCLPKTYTAQSRFTCASLTEDQRCATCRQNHAVDAAPWYHESIIKFSLSFLRLMVYLSYTHNSFKDASLFFLLLNMNVISICIKKRPLQSFLACFFMFFSTSSLRFFIKCWSVVAANQGCNLCIHLITVENELKNVFLCSEAMNNLPEELKKNQVKVVQCVNKQAE